MISKKTVLFVVSQPFPFGLASTNRMISLAKGLMLHNIQVIVFCIKPSKYPTDPSGSGKYLKSGLYQGIRFFYTTMVVKDSRNKLLKGFHLFYGIVNSIPVIISKNNKFGIDQIWVSFTKSYLVFLYYLISRYINSKYTLYRSEYPALERNKLSLYFFETFLSKRIFKLFDYFIIMTSKLKNYFDLRKSLNAKSVLIPMSVEPERFEDVINDITPIDDCEYIAYTGSLNSNKDGLDILIKAFHIISSEYNRINLYLIGDFPDESEKNKIMALINQLGIQNRIIITGVISRDSIPSYIINAKILVLARPENEQNVAGFPTKLGEYLITGKPVVATPVGEIQVYLENNLSVFFAEPGNYLDFASKLNIVLSNYEYALEVGKRGKEQALRYFDYRMQSQTIYEEIFSG